MPAYHSAARPRQADLLFNVDPSFSLVTQAAVAFDVECEEDWPYDELNGALAQYYALMAADPMVAVPHIYPVHNGTQTVGFIIRPRDVELADADLWEAFWGMLAAGGHADADDPDELQFLEPTPFFCPGGWDGIDVMIVAHPLRAGVPFPAEPVNTALHRLLGQGSYPVADLPLCLAPVRRGNGELTFGIWVAEGSELDNLAFDPERDDVAFRTIRDLNSTKNRSRVAATGFASERYLLS